MSLHARIGFTFGMFWGIVLWPLAIAWQNPVTYWACLVPVVIFIVVAVGWMLYAIWTEP